MHLIGCSPHTLKTERPVYIVTCGANPTVFQVSFFGRSKTGMLPVMKEILFTNAFCFCQEF